MSVGESLVKPTNFLDKRRVRKPKSDSSLMGIERGHVAYTLFFQKHTFLAEAESAYPNTCFKPQMCLTCVESDQNTRVLYNYI